MLAVENGIFYAPIYMVMFLQRDAMPEKMIYSVGAPLVIGKDKENERE